MDTSKISAFLAATPIPCDRAGKKSYTEQVSRLVTGSVSRQLQDLGLRSVVVPGRGRDKQFMGGYASKGVDTYLSDEKHGLLISSGSKGILYNVGKNVKNRYRDMVMEALELHKRFPYAVCGHFIFLSASEVEQAIRHCDGRNGDTNVQRGRPRETRGPTRALRSHRDHDS